MFTIRSTAVLIAILLLTTAASRPTASTAQDPGHVYDPGHAQGHRLEWKGDPYPLGTDPVSGVVLGPIEGQVIFELNGRELRFATRETADKFKTDPAKYLAAVDAKIVREQKPRYPLDTCVLSGRKLGDLGAPIEFVYRNRLVRLSSADGEIAFLQDPAKFIAILDRAVIADQKQAYPLDTCVVSGERLGGTMGAPVECVTGNRLVRLCCRDCTEKFRKDPLAYLAKLNSAHKTGPPGKPASKATTYTCPMHPEVVASGPSSCPKCGMDLVMKK